jgi:hypothetical protein
MRERPILFSGPMVLALLADRKTQTRRLPSEPHDPFDDFETLAPWMRPPCEFGDRLWVRETWAPHPNYAAEKPSEMPAHPLLYRATASAGVEGQAWRPAIFLPRWGSRLARDVTSVRCERLQSITDEDIIAEGVDRDTLDGLLSHRQQRELEEEEEVNGPLPLRACWAQGWDAINGKRAPWAWNPWVWRIEFRRVVST